jgi:hypothetical protein
VGVSVSCPNSHAQVVHGAEGVAPLSPLLDPCHGTNRAVYYPLAIVCSHQKSREPSWYCWVVERQLSLSSFDTPLTMLCPVARGLAFGGHARLGKVGVGVQIEVPGVGQAGDQTEAASLITEADFLRALQVSVMVMRSERLVEGAGRDWTYQLKT